MRGLAASDTRASPIVRRLKRRVNTIRRKEADMMVGLAPSTKASFESFVPFPDSENSMTPSSRFVPCPRAPCVRPPLCCLRRGVACASRTPEVNCVPSLANKDTERNPNGRCRCSWSIFHGRGSSSVSRGTAHAESWDPRRSPRPF